MPGNLVSNFWNVPDSWYNCSTNAQDRQATNPTILLTGMGATNTQAAAVIIAQPHAPYIVCGRVSVARGKGIMEEWRDIKGYEGLYQVSNLGRVRSRYVKGSHDIGETWRLVVTSRDGSGYLRATLCRDGKRFDFRVHNLVSEAFFGPCPSGMEVCHNDSDKANNRVENLRYDTRRANMIDRYWHGALNTKLTPDNVRAIREARRSGQTTRSLAKEYGLRKETINRIVSGKSFAWIE